MGGLWGQRAVTLDTASTLPSLIRSSKGVQSLRVDTPLAAENEGQISRVSAHWVLDMLYGDI